MKQAIGVGDREICRLRTAPADLVSSADIFGRREQMSQRRYDYARHAAFVLSTKSAYVDVAVAQALSTPAGAV
jgi:hypothetical protein